MWSYNICCGSTTFDIVAANGNSISNNTKHSFKSCLCEYIEIQIDLDLFMNVISRIWKQIFY